MLTKKQKTLSITDTSSFPKPQQQTIETDKSSIIKQNGKTTFVDLRKGDVVTHKNPALGKGTIVELDTDKNSIKINFNGTVKAYAIDHCVKFNLLTKDN